MQGFLIVALVVALVAVMFALQNIVPVTVAFMTWTFEGSLALLLFIALVVGAVISFLASLPALVKGRLTASTLRKRVAALEAELADRSRRPAPLLEREPSAPPSPEPAAAEPPRN